MSEMRKLMEAMSEIYESDWPAEIGSGSGNADIIHAYDDDAEFGRGRKLMEIGQPGNLETWRTVMSFALRDSESTYNEFDVDKVYNVLKQFPAHEQCDFFPAREYSVAMYIGTRGNEELLNEFFAFIEKNRRAMKVDERHIQPETDFSDQPHIRLWWD